MLHSSLNPLALNMSDTASTSLCFNPCFIGTYSFTPAPIGVTKTVLLCFNPCFIGTYSFTLGECKRRNMKAVF